MRVLITGTSSGIGKAIAEKFLKEGFDVTGFDRKEASISQDLYTHFCLDIRAREQYPALAPFDIVINNAGVQNEDDIDINLKGTIAITEAYGIHDNIRAILMIGSASGHTGAEFPEYTASKGGVLAYTKNVALRIAPYGGTCNSLDFGGVLTELNLPVTEDQKLWDQIMELTPLKRWMYRDGEEQELFRTVERLLRDPGECRRLGENAQQTIVGEWNARTAAERLIELCRKMKFLPEMSEEQEMPDAGQDVMQDITTPAPVIPQLWNDGPCSPAPVIPERSMYRRINSEQ